MYSGWRQHHSLSGSAAYYGRGIAYKIDGKIRLPEYVVYYAGGAMLLATGAMVVLHGRGLKKTGLKRRRPR